MAALVADEFVGSPTAQVALAAPTGKAAARMAESVAESIDLLSAADDEPIVAAASALQLVVPSTVHRLLGARGSDSFRYDLHNPLPFDLIVVDEASMLSLPLVDALLQALHPPQGWCSSEMQASWRVLMRVQCSAISRETVQFIHA